MEWDPFFRTTRNADSVYVIRSTISVAYLRTSIGNQSVYPHSIAKIRL